MSVKRKRINANFHAKKDANQPIRFITVIVPNEKGGDNAPISASFVDEYTGNSMKLEVKVGKDKKRTLEFTL